MRLRTIGYLQTLVVATILAVIFTEDCWCSDSTVAVWYGEILDYGVVSTGTPEDTLCPMVAVYASPGDSVAIDSVRAGTVMKYERLSELRRVGPRRLARDQALRGEWFQVRLPDTVGWLPGRQFMTILGDGWGYGLDARLRVIPGPQILAIYMSGQFATSWAIAATLWTWDRSDDVWVLVDVVMNAMMAGLYMTPSIDSVDFSPGESFVYARSFGGDAGDAWGEDVTLRIRGDSLTIVGRKAFHESYDGP